MTHFLIQYRRSKGDLELMREYDDAHADEAADERLRLEIEHHADRDVEVIIIVSNDLASLKRTHARYFKGAIGESIKAYRQAAGLSISPSLSVPPEGSSVLGK
jgi:hypothetical protein